MRNTPEIRFKGFSDDWAQRKLGEVAEFNPRSILPESFEYVDLESVVGTSLVSHRTEYKDTAPSRAQRLAKNGDVFFDRVGGIFSVACFCERNAHHGRIPAAWIQHRVGRGLCTILGHGIYAPTADASRKQARAYPSCNVRRVHICDFISQNSVRYG